MWYIYIIFFADGYYYVGKRKCPSNKNPWSDAYMGSPSTHKMKWTSGIKFLKVIHTFGIESDNSAKKKETGLLQELNWKNDHFCLNEHDGESWTEEGSSRGGKTTQSQKTPEERSEHAKLMGSAHGPLSYINKTALFSLTPEQQKNNAKLGGQTVKEQRLGIFAISPEEHSKNSRKAGKTTSALRYQCLVTGHVSTPGGLARWQKKRGIDTSLRVKLTQER